MVRWRGYGSDDDTWEPNENLLTCQEMVEHFWKKKEEARKVEKLKKKKKVLKHKDLLEVGGSKYILVMINNFCICSKWALSTICKKKHIIYFTKCVFFVQHALLCKLECKR